MLKAAGACIIAKDTKRILLQQRSTSSSHPRTWGFWGGKIENNENVSQGMLREIEEEIGMKACDISKVYPLDQYHARDNTFSYYSFVILTEKEFIPTLNSETGGYAWINHNHFPKPLHPGTRRTIFAKKKLSTIKKIIYDI